MKLWIVAYQLPDKVEPRSALGDDFASPLALLDFLLSWDGYPYWRGYVHVAINAKYTGVHWLMAMEPQHKDCKCVGFDLSRRDDLEYVEQKIVEMWEFASDTDARLPRPASSLGQLGRLGAADPR